MALTFRRALTANAISSLSGMATQAANAPLMLAAFRVDQYAQWILVTAVCSYLSLALNGLFYALLNEITIASARGDRRQATALYGLGLAFIAAMFAAFVLIYLAILLAGPQRLPASALPLVLGMLVQTAGLTAILFDANFRAIERYQFGTNVLTIGRTLDWLMAIGLAFALKDVTAVFGALAIYKVAQTAVMFVYLRTVPDALAPRASDPKLRDAIRVLGAARGQMVLSASTAATTMGPQIVVSLFFSDIVIVAFSTYRTYLRLLSAGVGVLTSASWPLLNEMFGRGEFDRIEAFLSRLLARVAALTAVGGIGMIVVSGPVFQMLFRGKVEADPYMMSVILASVVANAIITVYQSLYLSTNMRSRALVGALGITLASLAFMSAASHLLPFYAVLVGQAAFDVWILLLMRGATRTLFRERRREMAA